MLLEQLQKTLHMGASSDTAAAHDTSVLVIKHDDARTGGIVHNGTVQVDGRVEGDIRCKRLVVTAQAFVDGTITARSAHIDGTVIGPIHAARVSLTPTAVVKGNITYESLHIATGASVSGICRDRGHASLRAFESADADAAPPLPFSIAKAACRRYSIKFAPVPPLRLAGCRRAVSMKAVWEHFQQIAPATRQ